MNFLKKGKQVISKYKNVIFILLLLVAFFMLLRLLYHYKQSVEKFENKMPDAPMPAPPSATPPILPNFDLSAFQSKDFKDSSNSIKEFVKTINGGIQLKEDDLKETPPVNVDIKKYSDDNIPNPLKQAQKETHELINTVNALKDTLTTLAPVLSEGKKLMNMFENLKV